MVRASEPPMNVCLLASSALLLGSDDMIPLLGLRRRYLEYYVILLPVSILRVLFNA